MMIILQVKTRISGKNTHQILAASTGTIEVASHDNISLAWMLLNLYHIHLTASPPSSIPSGISQSMFFWLLFVSRIENTLCLSLFPTQNCILIVNLQLAHAQPQKRQHGRRQKLYCLLQRQPWSGVYTGHAASTASSWAADSLNVVCVKMNAVRVPLLVPKMVLYRAFSRPSSDCGLCASKITLDCSQHQGRWDLLL